MIPSRPASGRLGAFRQLALTACAAFSLVSCQSPDLQGGLNPSPGGADSGGAVPAGLPAQPAGAIIQGLTLSPTSASLAPGAKVTFTPLGWLPSGPPPVIASVTWTATGGTISDSGVYTAGNVPGTFQVLAKSTTTAWIQEPATITISGTPLTVSRITLTPATVSLGSGARQQFAVSATMSNGTTQTSPAVTWTATGGTISTSGLYTAGSTAGSFRVIAASANGKADTSAVAIGAAVTSITLTPATASLAAGATRQFSVTALLSNGTTQANPAVTWTGTGGSISASGLYTAGSTTGSFRVIAASSNGKADTSAVTVTAPTAVVTAVSLTPATVSLAPGATQQFTTSATLSGGGTQANPAVTWTATGGSVTAGGLYTAGATSGVFRIIATAPAGPADTSAVTITGTAPPPGPVAMYFNSTEAGCGTDGNTLLCDDFERGAWYGKNCDQANSSGGLLQTAGWCGTIYPMASATATPQFLCGGKGFRSQCAASGGYHDGTIGGGYMAQHAFSGGKVSEAWFRVYFQPQADYDGGHEKMFGLVEDGNGSNNLVSECYNYFGGEDISCIPMRHQDLPSGAGAWVPPNVAPSNFRAGHWYAFQVHVKLNTPGQANGTLEYYLDDCTTGPCSGTPTLRGRSTTVLFRDASETSMLLGGIWIENWANAPTRGTMLYDNVRVSKVGPIAFAP